MKRGYLATFLLLLPRAAFAQNACELVNSRQFQSVASGAVIYVGAPVFSCTNGSRILADSAIIIRENGRADFLGNVRFTDAERTLTAQNAQYMSRERRLMAQINVVLTNRKDGSSLRGTSMDYYQTSPTYPEGRIDVHTGRPRAMTIRKRANSTAIDTTVIDSDRMQIIGEHTFRGWGNVQTRRADMRTVSQFAEFNEQANQMVLSGQATITSDTFRLRADSINAIVVNGDEFRELQAFRQVILETEGVDLTAPQLRLNFDKGEVERLVAIGGKRISPEGPQARAVSPDFVLVADSIDAISPKQKLERVFAIGRARGEAWTDTVADRDLPQLIRNDWVQGDTVRAYFGERKPAPPGARQIPKRPARTAVGQDSTRVLERIAASGAPASSTYRLREQVGDSVEISVNYLTARKLDVTFRDGAVHKVSAEGEIRGLYLQPPSRAQATAPRRQP
jgi:lipopolysaccharide export system protein LptA